MFMTFFSELRQAKVPVTLKEYLVLMEALDKSVIDRSVEDFYFLSRATLVKDEKNLDKFDRVFSHVFKGLESVGDAATAEIPAEWLKLLTEKFLTDEEKAAIEAMGGFEELMKTLQERLEEQKKRHEGGNKMIGTAGTSPFGAYATSRSPCAACASSPARARRTSWISTAPSRAPAARATSTSSCGPSAATRSRC
jgi:uncharacterized protein with von Willebrand factor type A (vWA) domain